MPPKRLRHLMGPVDGKGLNSGRMILLSSPCWFLFLLEILDDDLLVAVHPSGTANQEEREGIHEAIIPSAHNGDQHFVAERPLGLARKDPHSKSLNVVRVLGRYGFCPRQLS